MEIDTRAKNCRRVKMQHHRTNSAILLGVYNNQWKGYSSSVNLPLAKYSEICSICGTWKDRKDSCSLLFRTIMS